jgi:transcriptional regulator with XRE-family HTH domain
VTDLAAALEVDRSYITHLENGSKLRVSPEFYAALLRELQIEDYRALLATAPLRQERGWPAEVPVPLTSAHSEVDERHSRQRRNT